MSATDDGSWSPILAAARSVFLEQGFHGASVREIAKRAGLTVPALYYHHESKEGLLMAILLRAVTNLSELTERIDATPGTPAERLGRLTHAIVMSIASDAPTFAIDSSEARYLGPQNHERYAELRGRVEDVMRGVVTDGLNDGSFDVDDVSTTSRAIFGMLMAIPRWYNVEGPESPETIAERYAHLTVNMVRNTAN